MKKEEYLTEEDINKAVEALKASTQEVADRDFIDAWDKRIRVAQIEQLIRSKLTPFENFLFTNKIAVFFRLYKLVDVHIAHTLFGVEMYKRGKLVGEIREE